MSALAAQSLADWATYRHDNRRSGVTDEKPSLPLNQSWVRESPSPPMTAWPGPAKWDAYSGNKDLQSMRNFDPAFYVTTAGNRVYFGSSVDHATHCLDADTGRELWTYPVGGAVRLPPVIAGGRALFGSDDGKVYCLDAATGALQWKYKAAKDSRLIPSDNKIISPWPVRTGVLVRDNTAYFAASLVPWETTYLCALSADKGQPHYVREETGVTLQGALLASSDKLYAPQGRSVPLVYQLDNGKRLKDLSGLGGTFCLLTEDERLIAMPHNQKSSDDVIQIADLSGKQSVLQFAGADRLLVAGNMAYLHQQKKLKALDRGKYAKLQTQINTHNSALESAGKKITKLKKSISALKDDEAEEKTAMENEISALQKQVATAKAKTGPLQKELASCTRWEVAGPAPLDLILAGDVLFAGETDGVRAIDVKSGDSLWSAKVRGKVYGLAFSNNRLFVSTSLGHIYCFSSNP